MPPLQPDPTTVHLRQAMGGDHAALSWIVARFTPVLLAQARHRLGPLLVREADPEDVVGEVWVAALPRLAELSARDGRHTPVLLRFLSTAVLNKVNNLLTRTLRRRGDGQAEPEPPASALPASVTDAFERLARDERAVTLRQRIEALSEADRELVVLRGIEQRSNAEAAELLGVTPNTCAVRFRRALERLREGLEGTLLDDLELD